MTNEGSETPEQGSSASAGEDDAAQAFREQQAIAQAMMIGEQMRRSDRSSTYFYVKRIGLFVSVLSLMGMIMLFAYARLTKGDFNSIPGMMALGILMAGGATASYWGYAESRRSEDD